MSGSGQTQGGRPGAALTEHQSRADQAPVEAFLADSASYGAGAGPVERIETHIGIVFLVGARAFKMKKAVDLGYLDFTTLEKRRWAVERELRLNARIAPQLYRRVVAVTREAGGRLCLDGLGEPVEWVLEMVRFDRSETLDLLAAGERLPLSVMGPLAREIIRAQSGAPVCLRSGLAAAVTRVQRSNGGHIERYAGTVLDPGAVAALAERTAEIRDRYTDLMEMRARRGLVRTCHGDMHLANIVLLDGAPILFDCIEFSEDIACVDVMYDFAFLLMDLDIRGLCTHANALLNAYAEALDASALEAFLSGLVLLPMYLSMRAAVRCHVSAQMAASREGADKMQLEASSAAYLAHALDYLTPPRPRVVAIGGLSGTGKSTLAKALAPALPDPQAPAPCGALILRSDVIRKRIFGCPIDQPLPPEAYAETVSHQVHRLMMQEARAVLAAGRSVVLDAVFLDPRNRALAEAAAQDMDAAFTGFWLEGAQEDLAGRVAARRGDASDATPDVLAQQARKDPGALTWTRIATAGGPEAVAAAARGALSGA